MKQHPALNWINAPLLAPFALLLMWHTPAEAQGYSNRFYRLFK
jgi:hypothetical protein